MPKAIITGASAGIGEALARRLAQDGYDLLLVARRTDRLEKLAAELKEKHKIQAEAMGLDVTAPDAAQKLIQKAGDADVLVNNAGYGKHGGATEISVEHATGMVRLNCESLTGIMMAFLPRMVERKRGTILNVASIAGFEPTPWFAVYSATKAYVLSLSQAVDFEVKSRGVRVLALCPGPVPTEFQAIADTTQDHAPALFRASAEKVADDAAWMIRRGRGVWVPNWWLRQGTRIESMLPDKLAVYIRGKAVPSPVHKPG